MADQNFDKQQNRFRIDLHKCATAEAIEIVRKRIDECYRYGITILEVIYGTPDNYAVSIEEAVRQIIADHPNVQSSSEIHAGLKIAIKPNPNALPRDEEMVCGRSGSDPGNFLIFKQICPKRRHFLALNPPF